MATISESLAIAVEQHQAGRLRVAEQIYRQILAVEPHHPDVLHLLGLIAHQTGQHLVAVEYIGRAIAINANAAAFHSDLGVCYRELQRLEDAVACYRRALELNPQFAGAHNNLGVALQDQGKPDEAAACYRQALALQPDYVEAHSNLGNVLRDQGKLEEALACYRRAVELKPDYAEARTNLGHALREQGNLEEAVLCYRRALERNPHPAKAYGGLGLVLAAQGRLDEAIAAYCRALELEPNYAATHNNLGTARREQAMLDEAVACFRRAVELKPDFAEAYYNLGSALMDLGKLDEAVASYRGALELKDDFAAAHNGLGSALRGQGKLEEAVACRRRVVDLQPDSADAHRHLGVALHAQMKPSEAAVCYRRALQLKPDFAEAHNNLGAALRDEGWLDEALACYRRTIELQPGSAEAYNNLGNALTCQGKLDDAVAAYQCARKLEPDYLQAHSNLLLTMQYRPGTTCAEIAAAHAGYDAQHAAALRATWRPHDNLRDPDRRLRLGFLSSDFGRHPVGFLSIGVLESLDRRQGETICYGNRVIRDNLATRFRAAAAVWRDVCGLSDERLAEQIRADRIDILFDLAGHTAGNRLLVFARRPAPIQITWLGYVGTTGLSAMDYILADPWQIPPNAEEHYRERVLRLPDGYVCYDPPSYAGDVGPLPADRNGYITFGSFNNLAKITPQVVAVWSEILRQIPSARLVLKYNGLRCPRTQQRYRELFASQGIGSARLELRGRSSHAEVFAEYNRIDVGLDPFPFSGGMTTCEALWMGVPVITCPGETFASRHSLSHLSNVGLTETIARDFKDYVDLAVRLAGNLPRLAAIRAGLRRQVAASPLCDGKRFAANLLVLLRGVWREWCRREPAE